MRHSVIRAVVAALSILLVPAGAAVSQDLPELALDLAQTTVSGLSSGAFMAVQMHVAFSEHIAGAGVVAGGPYFCAQGSLLLALKDCMETDPAGPDVAPLLADAGHYAASGEIDPLTGLVSDRVYLFSGTNDHTVAPPSVDAARRFYIQAGVAEADIRLVTDVPAGHGFLAPGGPVPCAETGPPFINDCGEDQAGDILTWLYGDLDPPVSPDPSRLMEFSQLPFVGNAGVESLDGMGYVYVPETCAAGETCRLHIAFHGCQQGRQQIGDLYARTTGYNGWAEANHIVVLYPQAIASSGVENPKGCWDWWGYGDDDYATRNGPQMAAVALMASRLGAPLTSMPDGATCISHEEFNWVHWEQNRAEDCGFFDLCAKGSGDNVGTIWGASTLYETRPDYYTLTPCR